MADNRVRLNQVRSPTTITQNEHCDIADAKRTKLVDALGNEINDQNKLPVEGDLVVSRSDLNPLQQVLTLALAGDVGFITVPPKTVSLEIAVRNEDTDFRYAFNASDIGNSIYKTVPCGNSVILSNIYNQNSQNIFIQADVDNAIIEIETYSE